MTSRPIDLARRCDGPLIQRPTTDPAMRERPCVGSRVIVPGGSPIKSRITMKVSVQDAFSTTIPPSFGDCNPIESDRTSMKCYSTAFEVSGIRWRMSYSSCPGRTKLYTSPRQPSGRLSPRGRRCPCRYVPILYVPSPVICGMGLLNRAVLLLGTNPSVI